MARKSTNALDLQAEIAELQILLRALGEEAIMMRNGGKLGEKENIYFGDILTEADELVEKEIVKRIALRHPDHYVRGEQGNARGTTDSRYKWVVTPIDGTRNFSKGLSFFAIMIAFLDRDKPLMGVVYFPELARFVYAIVGQGVYDNNKELKMFERPETIQMSHALIAGSTTRRRTGRAEVLGALRVNSLNIINTGSTAYNVMLLVERKIDAVVNADAVIFNIVALVPILKEAGCFVSGFNKEDNLDLQLTSTFSKNPAMFADNHLAAGTDKDRIPFIAASNRKLIVDIKKRILPVWRKAKK